MVMLQIYLDISTNLTQSWQDNIQYRQYYQSCVYFPQYTETWSTRTYPPPRIYPATMVFISTYLSVHLEVMMMMLADRLLLGLGMWDKF